MGKYRFSAVERQSVYSVHGERCYMCGDLLYLKTMEVDHILPECLLDDPARLAEVLKEFGLPDDFGINSYANWMPACRRCNKEKQSVVFAPSPIIQAMIQRAISKAPLAKALAEETSNNVKIFKALGVLESADEKGELPDAVRQALAPLALYQVAHRGEEQLVAQPVRLAPNYTVGLEIEFAGGCRNGEVLRSGSPDLDVTQAKWLLLTVGLSLANAERENRKMEYFLKWRQPMPEVVKQANEEGWSKDDHKEKMRYQNYYMSDYEERDGVVRFKAVYRDDE